MLKIRLTRRGKKNNAFFRIVVAEHTAPIKGGFLEVLGFLNPHTKEKDFKTDRIEYWIGKGAQCSDTVHNLLVSNSVIKGPKRAVKLKKKPVEEAKPEETKPADDKEAKPAETAEVESEEKVTKKPAEAVETKTESASPADKEVKEPEAVKPKPEKKEEKAEQPKTEEPKKEEKK
jgi:small subunit ribosomal protein S16